jgi:hypothetical protein
MCDPDFLTYCMSGRAAQVHSASQGPRSGMKVMYNVRPPRRRYKPRGRAGEMRAVRSARPNSVRTRKCARNMSTLVRPELSSSAQRPYIHSRVHGSLAPSSPGRATAGCSCRLHPKPELEPARQMKLDEAMKSLPSGDECNSLGDSSPNQQISWNACADSQGKL